MKKFFNKDFWQLPEFMYDRHLRVLAWMLALVAVICVILAFRTNIILGYISMVFMLIMTVVAYITLKQVTEDTTEYISDLSYRIKRGEQDALIKMPIGILFYDKEGYIE